MNTTETWTNRQPGSGSVSAFLMLKGPARSMNTFCSCFYLEEEKKILLQTTEPQSNQHSWSPLSVISWSWTCFVSPLWNLNQRCSHASSCHLTTSESQHVGSEVLVSKLNEIFQRSETEAWSSARLSSSCLKSERFSKDNAQNLKLFVDILSQILSKMSTMIKRNNSKHQ